MAAAICILHHHIGLESVFEMGLDVASTRRAYEAQIDRLVRDYDPIDLTTLLSGRLPRRPLLLTFDDAFRSVLDVARDLLAPRGIPAVFFVNPGLLGRTALSLDGALAWAAQTVGLDRVCNEIGISRRETVGQVIAQDMAERCAHERAKIRDRIVTSFGPPDFAGRAPILEEDDLKLLPGLGVEIANHTMTHTHCRALTESELQSEIFGSKARLEALSGKPVRAFSVPYGNERDLTPQVLKALRASGHAAIFLVHARSNAHRSAPDIWYRTSLHDEAPGDLRRKLHYLPVLRSLKNRLVG